MGFNADADLRIYAGRERVDATWEAPQLIPLARYAKMSAQIDF